GRCQSSVAPRGASASSRLGRLTQALGPLPRGARGRRRGGAADRAAFRLLFRSSVILRYRYGSRGSGDAAVTRFRLTLPHPSGLLGASFASVAGSLLVVILAADVAGFEINPYFGLVALLALPAALVAGLLLIPLGAWLDARRSARPYPVLDVNR